MTTTPNDADRTLENALRPALKLLDRATGEGLDICGIDAGDTWDELAKAAGMDDVNDENHFVETVIEAYRLASIAPYVEALKEARGKLTAVQGAFASHQFASETITKIDNLLAGEAK